MEVLLKVAGRYSDVAQVLRASSSHAIIETTSNLRGEHTFPILSTELMAAFKAVYLVFSLIEL